MQKCKIIISIFIIQGRNRRRSVNSCLRARSCSDLL